MGADRRAIAAPPRPDPEPGQHRRGTPPTRGHPRGGDGRPRAAAVSAQGAAAAGRPNVLSSALGRLFAVAENYPELKADQNFRQLQEELSETEGQGRVRPAVLQRQCSWVEHADRERSGQPRGGLMRPRRLSTSNSKVAPERLRRSVSSECSARLGRARRLVAGLPAGIPRRAHRCGSRGRAPSADWRTGWTT